MQYHLRFYTLDGSTQVAEWFRDSAIDTDGRWNPGPLMGVQAIKAPISAVWHSGSIRFFFQTAVDTIQEYIFGPNGPVWFAGSSFATNIEGPLQHQSNVTAAGNAV